MKVTTIVSLQMAPTLAGQSTINTGNTTHIETTVGEEISEGIQAIGTSEEAITIPTDLGTVGKIWMKNLDLTNFVDYGAVTLQLPFRLNPLEAVVIRLATQGLFLKADGAEIRLEYKMFEV